MSVNPTMQLILLIYEYLYNKGNRIEKAYNDLLNDHYRDMFASRPDLIIRSIDLVKLIERKAQFEQFVEIQTELYEILKTYKKDNY